MIYSEYANNNPIEQVKHKRNKKNPVEHYNPVEPQTTKQNVVEPSKHN